MKVTRWAVRIQLPDSAKAHYNGSDYIWHCQGAPRDPSDFGDAILFHSHDAALHAIKTGRSYIQLGYPVEIVCDVPDLTE